MSAGGTTRRVAVLAVAVALLLTGCNTTLKDVPVPGTGVSGDTITVQADFADALNLAEGATVKVNGVDSGKVLGVTSNDFAARAELKVQTEAELRQGATARLRYTTPLGELFVDVANPESGALMGDGDELGLESTDTAPTVEDALSQASLLINGGGLAQLQIVTEELNTAVNGRESTVRALLEQAEDLTSQTNDATGDIDLALRSLASVSRTLQEREDVINRAVREIRPAARVLRDNTPGLTQLLREVQRFAATANGTVAATRDNILRVLRDAEPVLAELARNRTRFPLSLDKLTSLGKQVDGVIPNDFAAFRIALELDSLSAGDLQEFLDGLGIPIPDLGLPRLQGRQRQLSFNQMAGER